MSIIPLQPTHQSLQRVRRELALNYLQIRNFRAAGLNRTDRLALEQIGHFIQYGGLAEGWASVSHNNEVLKRILQRAKYRPPLIRRVINWLNEVPIW